MNRAAIRLMSLILPALILAAAVPATAADDFACRAEVNRTTVPQGGDLLLTVTAEGSLALSSEFTLPAIPGVQVYRSGTNQSVTFANGVTNTLIARTFYLRVETARDFVIPPVEVDSQGQICATEPVTIKVTRGEDPGRIPPADTGNRTVADPVDNLQVTGGVGGRAGDDIFITLEASLQDAWVGQQVILTFKYFRRIQPWNNPLFTPPRTEGFWREDLGEERDYRQMVQGRSYTVTEKRYALFPSQVGDLVIEPAELAFRDQGLDRFFSSQRRRGGPRVLRTDPLTVHVRDLPSPRPEGFTGLVATHVRLMAVPGRTEVPRGEPVDLKVTLVGDGFLKGFTGLEIPAPVDARQHDAGNDFSTRLESGRLFSRIEVEKVIVPGREGPMALPPVRLTWFDALEGIYRTTETQERDIQVLPSDLPYDDEATSGFLRSSVSRLGQDLLFIHRAPDRLACGAVSLGGSPAWWIGLLLPLAGLGAWRLYLNWARARDRDPVGRRRRLAMKTATDRLEAAVKAEDPATRLAGVDRAVTGFVADHLDLPVAAVGADQVQAFCDKLELVDTGRALAAVLADCDGARFGGGDTRDVQALAEVARGHLADLADRIARSDRKTAGTGGAKRLPLWALLLLPLLMTGAAEAEPTPLQLLAEANQAYTEGDLDVALEKYLAVRRAGVNDAVLHFNLGNTYARRGDLGRAVASYLRAQRLAPRDRDVRGNLAYVRTHLKDLELSNQTLPLFIAQFAGLARALTVREWGAVLVCAVWALAGLIAWGWYRDRFSDGVRRAALLIAALLVVTACITGWRWYGEEVRERAVVVVEEASVHSGPADSFPVMFQVHDGLTVHIEAERGDWLRINLGGKSLGWLPASSLETVSLPAPEDQGR